MIQPTNIDEYIAAFPPGIQESLQKIRATIRAAAPNTEEAIKYRMPTFVLHENLVHFAAFKNHIGFFPTSSGIAAFSKDLKGYKTSKGTVQFPFDRPIPFGLIKRIVRFRAKEARSRHAGKKGKRYVRLSNERDTGLG